MQRLEEVEEEKLYTIQLTNESNVESNKHVTFTTDVVAQKVFSVCFYGCYTDQFAN